MQLNFILRRKLILLVYPHYHQLAPPHQLHSNHFHQELASSVVVVVQENLEYLQKIIILFI